MRERYGIRDNDFLTFDALRQAAQCVGRVIRSKTDYGVVILADSRYNRTDKRSKFPPWILQFVRESCLNLPTDAAVDQIKTFLRQMGQPIDQESLHSILLNEAQVNSMFQVHKLPPSATLLESEARAAQVAAQLPDPAAAGAAVGDAGVPQRVRAGTDDPETEDENAEEYGYGLVVDADGEVIERPVTAPAITASSTFSSSAGKGDAVEGANPEVSKLKGSNSVGGGPLGAQAALSRRSVFLFEDILDGSDGEQ